MKHVLLCLLLPAAASAQRLDADGDAFVWRNGDETIRVNGASVSAGLAGGPSLSWQMVLWHDDWVYESQTGGLVESGPTLVADGSMAISGAFSTTDDAPAVLYSQTVTPSETGINVRCELRKSGELRLPRGVLLHVNPDDRFTGSEMVWGDPSWHTTQGKVASGPVKRLLFELREGRSLALIPSAFRAAEKDTYGNSKAYRLGMVARDFEVGETVVAEYAISFDDMPSTFPGDVEPMVANLAINSVGQSATKVGLYEKLELTVDLTGTYDNPYDPDEIALDAIVTAPSGKTQAVPGFFMVEQDRAVEDSHELVVPRGNGVWKVRYAPTEIGRHRYVLRLRDSSGVLEAPAGSFRATRGSSKGFVRPSEVDPHYMAFDNGEGYMAIGHNLPIYHTSGQLTDEALRRYAEAGENHNRWWMSSSGLGIEWMEDLGWYRQDNAYRMDYALDLAEELDLYYMLCMDTHQDFREGGWLKNPFNAINGGPCETAGDWFTNEEAREFYRKRLRYTVARWGYSPRVLCWEFGNEFQGWADSPNEIKLPWHEEMSDYLAKIDPWRHMITTSWWGGTGPREFWALPNIDIVQTHCYTNDDSNVAIRMRQYGMHQWETFDKPHIFGEFGIRSHSTTADKDPEGWAVHNALWSGLLAFNAGPPMPWWHENYIDKLDLYFHFGSLANFVDDLPFGTAEWSLLDVSGVEFADPNHVPDARDAEIIPMQRWGKPEYAEFVLGSNGLLVGDLAPQELLQGTGHEDIKNPPTFIANYPTGGEFIVKVGVVSNSGLLRVWIDDEQVLEREFPCGEGLGLGSTFRETWDLWETTYNEDISIPVPAGEHRIRVENFGDDWIKVRGYAFTDCTLLDSPDVIAVGMRAEDAAIVWLQNRTSSWYNHAGNGEVSPVDAFTVDLELANGKYDIEWWETWRGSIDRTETATVKDGLLTLNLPGLEAVVALKLRRR